MQTPNPYYRVMASRLRTWDRAFKKFVSSLCREDIVVEAYLVGSRARGDYLPYSDYDVVVVVPDNVDKFEAVVKLRSLREESFPLDLIVLHASEISDSIYAEMMKNAKRLCRNT